MTDQSGSDSLKEQIYQRMREKETEELMAIWQENNREGWTEDAFEAIKVILLERLGGLPEQGVENQSKDLVEEFIFPSDKNVFRIADLSERLSWIILTVGIVYSVLQLIRYFSEQFSLLDSARWFNAVIVLFSQINNVFFTGFAFLVLQAVSEIIYLLMDVRDIVLPLNICIERANHRAF